MTRKTVYTCDRCHKEDSIGYGPVKYPDESYRDVELELCQDCWVSFHDWRWMRQ